MSTCHGLCWKKFQLSRASTTTQPHRSVHDHYMDDIRPEHCPKRLTHNLLNPCYTIATILEWSPNASVLRMVSKCGSVIMALTILCRGGVWVKMASHPILLVDGVRHDWIPMIHQHASENNSINQFTLHGNHKSRNYPFNMSVPREIATTHALRSGDLYHNSSMHFDAGALPGNNDIHAMGDIHIGVVWWLLLIPFYDSR